MYKGSRKGGGSKGGKKGKPKGSSGKNGSWIPNRGKGGPPPMPGGKGAPLGGPPMAGPQEGSDNEDDENAVQVGDSVRLTNNVAECKQHLQDAGLDWKDTMASSLGKVGVVEKVEIVNGIRICGVRVGREAFFAYSAKSLEAVDEESDGDDEEDAEDEMDDESGEQQFRVGQRVRDDKRGRKGNVAVGVVTKTDGAVCDVQFDDGSSEQNIKVDRLRIADLIKDASGFSGDGTFNHFDFTGRELPTGVEAVGDGIEFCQDDEKSTGSHLVLKKNTFLRVPFRGLQHDQSKAGFGIKQYTMTMELQLSRDNCTFASPWSLYQASYPEINETDQVSFATAKPEKSSKWTIRAEVEKLQVFESAELDSKVVAKLAGGTVLTQTGEIERLPNGLKRCPVSWTPEAQVGPANCPQGHALQDYKTPHPGYSCNVCRAPIPVHCDIQACRQCNFDICNNCLPAYKKGNKSKPANNNDDMDFDLFGGGLGGLPGGAAPMQIGSADSDAESIDEDTEEDEREVIRVKAGYWGTHYGFTATAIRISCGSGGPERTFAFHPGYLGGAASIDNQAVKSIGWTPSAEVYHTLQVTARKSGEHTFTIIDGEDPSKTWSTTFRGDWWDGLYGRKAYEIFDFAGNPLKLGEDGEVEKTSSKGKSIHKFRVVEKNREKADADEKPSKGWITFRKTELDEVEDTVGRKARKGPCCTLQANETSASKRVITPNRWHSLTVVVDIDAEAMHIYVDGMEATAEGGISLPQEDEDEEKQMMMALARKFGHRGSSLAESPYAVPRRGLLLFASNSDRGMPGGVRLRSFQFRNGALSPTEVANAYAMSRYKPPAKKAPEALALVPILRKKAPPIWIHPAFLMEMGDPVFDTGGSWQIVQLLRIFCLVLERAIEGLDVGHWDPARDALGCFRRAEILFKKYQVLLDVEDAESIPYAAAGYIKKLQEVRKKMTAGDKILIPLAVSEDKQRSMVMLVLYRGTHSYTLMLVNPGGLGIAYHPVCCTEPPKLKYNCAMVFKDISAEKMEDDGWWSLLVLSSVFPVKGPIPLYDKFIPWLLDCPLEHYLARGSAEEGLRWQTRQYSDSSQWRSLSFTLKLLVEEAGVPTHKVKFLKLEFRRALLALTASDLKVRPGLSVSEREVIKLGAAQLAFAAVKLHARLTEAGSEAKDEDGLLQRTKEIASGLDSAVERKAALCHQFDDPAVLPQLFLKAGAEEVGVADWGLHPFFDRLVREARGPGTRTGIPVLVPIDLLSMPQSVDNLKEAFTALRTCESLCAKLSWVGRERCKLQNFLIASLLQQTFTNLIPLPIGPVSQKAPMSLLDTVWAPAGYGEVHPSMTRSVQLELLMILQRLCEHFVAASSSIKSSRGFDGVKIVVLGAIAACTDAVLRVRCVGLFGNSASGQSKEPEGAPSELGQLLNGTHLGLGDKSPRPFAVDPVSFLKQSETIEVASPAVSVTRTAVASYFSEVMVHLNIKRGADETVFDWDLHGWMLFVDKEKGLKRLVTQLSAIHLYDTSGTWAESVCGGANPYLCHVWPEFACYRDVVFWWKYFLCTDIRIFPPPSPMLPTTAYLTWQVCNEQDAFGCPPNRGRVFLVKALGKEHLMTHEQDNKRPKPPPTGHRWPSTAIPSAHTKTPVRTEDDLLYMRTLPTFEDSLRQSDAEALLSFLTVPYIRQPLTLTFFTSGDRVNCLFNEDLQSILQSVLLEPGRLLEPVRWFEVPTTVPAASAAEAELIATPFGQLLTELSASPTTVLAHIAKLVNLTMVLANSVTSDTRRVILYATRVAARVESHVFYLLRLAAGERTGVPPAAAQILKATAGAEVLSELRRGRNVIRKLFGRLLQCFDGWLDELGQLSLDNVDQKQETQKAEVACGSCGNNCRFMVGSYNRYICNLCRSGNTGARWFCSNCHYDVCPKCKPESEDNIDEYMVKACSIHSHILLIHRNLAVEDLDEASVTKILSSFSFLSVHHTWNRDFLEIPEPELFEIYDGHRRNLIQWLEQCKENRKYGPFNRVLQAAHRQFSTLDVTRSGEEKERREWALVGGGEHDGGRYGASGLAPDRPPEQKEIRTLPSSDDAYVELNVQLMQVTVRGQYVTPLEEETYTSKDFQDVLYIKGKSLQTIQCAALLDTSKVKVRELLAYGYRTTLWNELQANILPYQGNYDRLYDVEDLEPEEQWISDLFEPIRRQFFVVPMVKSNTLFFLREEATPVDATVAVVVGVEPNMRGRIWKEVLIFKELRIVQIYAITSYGHQHYRSLEYTSNCKRCLAALQPDPSNRRDTWPEYARHEAGKPVVEVKNFPACVAVTRIIQRDSVDSGRRSDTLDDDDQWSEGDPSDDEGEGCERTVWEHSQREGEQFLPTVCLWGILPAVLLERHRFYQENEWPNRTIRGYPLNLNDSAQGEEEKNPGHIIDVFLLKSPCVPCTQYRGWCATVRRRTLKDKKGSGSPPELFLLSLLYAKAGTPLFSLARTLSRLEDLSHVLAWTDQDPRKASTGCPNIFLVELPRLQLSFRCREVQGELRLYSMDHAELYVPVGTDTAVRSQAQKLLRALPHSILLQTENQEMFVLVPNVRPARPRISADPFSRELVFVRSDNRWMSKSKNKHFLYPVHASLSMLECSTVAGSLYLLLLQWLNRQFSAAATLVNSVATDQKYEEGEMQIFQSMTSAEEQHPNSCALALQITLAVSDSGMSLPWELIPLMANYITRLSHVSARCRLSREAEIQLLALCQKIRTRFDIVNTEVSGYRKRAGTLGQLKIKKFMDLLTNRNTQLESTHQDNKELESWIRVFTKKLRAESVQSTREDILDTLTRVLREQDFNPGDTLQLDNRSAYWEALNDNEQEVLTMKLPKRPTESWWQTHIDQNVLFGSQYNTLWEVLGAEVVLDANKDEEDGPEVPPIRRLPCAMAMESALSVLSGEKSVAEAPTFVLLYSILTKSVRVRLTRHREIMEKHEHTFARLLLHLAPEGHNHGTLLSILHILSENPSFCEKLPLLNKPKTVRKVKDWKEKLIEIHEAIFDAAVGRQLDWPPDPEDFEHLPEELTSDVALSLMRQPVPDLALCPRLLFSPEVHRIGAGNFRPPQLSSKVCSSRTLRSSTFDGCELAPAEFEALAHRPLKRIVDEHLVHTTRPQESQVSEKLPFNMSTHPCMEHTVAQKMLQRLNDEMKTYACRLNGAPIPQLKCLQASAVQSIVDGDSAAADKALEQLASLQQMLLTLQCEDEEFLGSIIPKIHDAANEITKPDERDGLRYWLLRFSEHEAKFWFEHLCCGLLSGDLSADCKLINPFLTEEKVQGIVDALILMMVRSNRLSQICRAATVCRQVHSIITERSSATSKAALFAAISEKTSVLCNALQDPRAYVAKDGSFDPSLLLFEFVSTFLLRPRQVELVDEFATSVKNDRSVVKQMIMGAGKTTCVSPLLALILADTSRLVCCICPHALLEFSRHTLQKVFSTIVQKRISTFKCDRSSDVGCEMFDRMQKIMNQGDVVVTTPGDVKSLLLNFLEHIDIANTRGARRNTSAFRGETVQMGKTLQLFKQGVCLVDEVDLVLHPLRSELNFPTGQKDLISYAPDRWHLSLHLLEGFFASELAEERLSPQIRESPKALGVLASIRSVVEKGVKNNLVQKNPHLTLLNEEFYHVEMKTVMCEWLSLWLTSQHVGQSFEEGAVKGDRGLTEQEIMAYALYRNSRLQLEFHMDVEAWSQFIADDGHAWLRSEREEEVGVLNVSSIWRAGANVTKGFVIASSYKVAHISSDNGQKRVLLHETEEGKDARLQRVGRLPGKDIQALNLSHDWLTVFLPHCLKKIDRVTFGIMSDDQVASALKEQPLMPQSRAKLAIPFVGKDVPSTASEFAHPDVVIGLTVLAYRYEGLRASDFEEILGTLTEDMEKEQGAMLERAAALRWRSWVVQAGAALCTTQKDLEGKTAEDLMDKMEEADSKKQRVLPLHLLERKSKVQMQKIFELLRKLPAVVQFYLEKIFPVFMRFQEQKLSASGQELGGSILFGQRIGFSGTPSDLMPRELGECSFEPGSEGEILWTMTQPDIVSVISFQDDWTVEAVLDRLAEEALAGKCNALIDTGALITGFSNEEVASYLLGHKKRADGQPHPELPTHIEGCVFIDEQGDRKILLRHSSEVVKLDDSGIPSHRRFAFYDQVHTTGMDIKHNLDAVAALTLGKDMTWRDYAQGAYRMRGIGRGQTIVLYMIPEVQSLIDKDLAQAKLPACSTAQDADSKNLLNSVAIWLCCNSVRSESIQYSMLQLQDMNNIWRKNALHNIMANFEEVTSDRLADWVKLFLESIDYSVPTQVPKTRTMSEVVETILESKGKFILTDDDWAAVADVRKNVAELMSRHATRQKQEEAGLDTEQQQEKESEKEEEKEKEQEKEQEIEVEKFVDLMYCRDDEEPEPWAVEYLSRWAQSNKVGPSLLRALSRDYTDSAADAAPSADSPHPKFYNASTFKLWQRKPLRGLPQDSLISANWFNMAWSGFRRVKNVYMQLEWVPDAQRVQRSDSPLKLSVEEEREMHRQLHMVWDLLTREVGSGVEQPADSRWIYKGPQVPSKQGTPAVLEPPSGHCSLEQLEEVLRAALDWGDENHSVAAALAAVGLKMGQEVDYTKMTEILCSAAFRACDEGRRFVLVSLAEAETLRRIMHARKTQNEAFLAAHPSTQIALRCVPSNHEIFDKSTGFQEGPPFQVRIQHQVARFLDAQTFYRPAEVSLLLRALQHDAPFARRRFFEGLSGCRRRGAIASLSDQPIIGAVRPWLEFELLLARIRSVRLFQAIQSQALSLEEAFKKYDLDNSGLLEPIEVCRALADLGFAFSSEEVVNWLEAIDESGDYCVDYAEFCHFVKQQAHVVLGNKLMNPPARRPPSKPAPLPPTIDEDIEETIIERKRTLKVAEAMEERQKVEEEEKIDVMIEEELGSNPQYGDSWTEYDFCSQRLPRDTFLVGGTCDLVPEGWGTGKYYLMFGTRSGIMVQNLRVGSSASWGERNINVYSMTLWFRMPRLPSKTDRLLLVDFPRSDKELNMEDEEESGSRGCIYVWRNGVIAPEGYNRPFLKRRQATSELQGEWCFNFQVNEKEYVAEMRVQVDPTGSVSVRPSKGVASRTASAKKQPPVYAVVWMGNFMDPGISGEMFKTEDEARQKMRSMYSPYMAMLVDWKEKETQGMKGPGTESEVKKWIQTKKKEIEKEQHRKELEESLRESQWHLLPSTQANRVCLLDSNPLTESAWFATGRINGQKLVLDVADSAGNVSVSIDADLVVGEFGDVTMRGSWGDYNDGKGPISAKKVMVSSRLPGIWHVDAQWGSDSLAHIFNVWFACLPFGLDDQDAASHALKVSGSILAGPAVKSHVSLDLAGEFVGTSQAGRVSFQVSGDGEWGGSKWEGRLEKDGVIRGQWKSADVLRGGQWSARRIPGRIIAKGVRPRCEEGTGWDVQECALGPKRDSSVAALKVGDKVRLNKRYQNDNDARFGILQPGDVGTITHEFPGMVPMYNVEAADGRCWNYRETVLEHAKTEKITKVFDTPIADAFKGAVFTRFPIRKGRWYLEVHVAQAGEGAYLGLAAGKLTDFNRVVLLNGTSCKLLDKEKEKPKKSDDDKPDGELKEAKSADAEAAPAAAMPPVSPISPYSPMAPMPPMPPMPMPPGKGYGKGMPGDEAGESDKVWDTASTEFGEPWSDGDILGVAIDMEEGKMHISLNGSYESPFGKAFDCADLLNKEEPDEALSVYFCLFAGDSGRCIVNLGQSAFAGPAPLPESYRSLGEALALRPTYKLSLPAAIKSWAVYAEPSMSSSSMGKAPLKDADVIEERKREAKDGLTWICHDAGWSPWSREVVGTVYEPMKLQPLWSSVDHKEKKREKKKAVREINAEFDKFSSQKLGWTVTDETSAEAQGTEGPTPRLLLSSQSTASDILRWTLDFTAPCVQPYFMLGVVPVSKADEREALVQETCAVKSTSTCPFFKADDTKEVVPVAGKIVEVICDCTTKKVSFLIGTNPDALDPAKTIDLPYEEEVKLAVTGWDTAKVELKTQNAKTGQKDEDSDDESDIEGTATTCGNMVKESTWHMASVCVDLVQGELDIWLDGEKHLHVRDPSTLVEDGPLSISSKEGVLMYAKRTTMTMEEREWQIGGHLRSMRIDAGICTEAEVWSQHLPKGVWKCPRVTCGSWNSADAKKCWRCYSVRKKTAPRPPNDQDPRAEGLTIITAESFTELVLESDKHVFVKVHAPWCGACKQIKGQWEDLAKMMQGSRDICIASLDADENDIPPRYFPESHIPVLKLFVKDKKHTPVTFQLPRTLEMFLHFIQEQTGVSLRDVQDAQFPQYKERYDVDRIIERLRHSALTSELGTGYRLRAHPRKALADLLYKKTLDPDELEEQPSEPALVRSVSGDSSISKFFVRAPSRILEAPEELGPPPTLLRARSDQVHAALAPPQLRRQKTISGPLETSSLPLSFLPPERRQRGGQANETAQKLRQSEHAFRSAILAQILDNDLTEALKKAQPVDPLEAFIPQFFLDIAKPSYNHRSFFNGRLRRSWKQCPQATKLVALTRIRRFLIRCLRNRTGEYLPPVRPPQKPSMVAAAVRHNWHRVEIAVSCELPDQQVRGLQDLHQLFDRGFPADGRPFGSTPLFLAALVGNLLATQFLFVRGANVHAGCGKHKVMPIEAAAAKGHIEVVEFLFENGACEARSLHYAAYHGHRDVVAYLIQKGVSSTIEVNGCSPFFLAMLHDDADAAQPLLPLCTAEQLQRTLPKLIRQKLSLPEQAACFHALVQMGGMRHSVIQRLVERFPKLTKLADPSAVEFAAPALMPTLVPLQLCLFKRLLSMEAKAVSSQSVTDLVARGLADGESPSALDEAGSCLLDTASVTGNAAMVKLLLQAGATVVPREPTRPSPLLWAHWASAVDVAGGEDCIGALVESGAQLTNSDLQGLQRLRTLKGKLENVEASEALPSSGKNDISSPPTLGRAVSEIGTLGRETSTGVRAPAAAADGEDDDATDETLKRLLAFDSTALWHAFHAEGTGYQPAVSLIAARMQAEGILPSPPSRLQVPSAPRPEFHVTTLELLDALLELDVLPAHVEGAKMFALRSYAVGGGCGLKATFALHCFLSIRSVSQRCMVAWAAACDGHGTAEEEKERKDIEPFLVQLTRSLETLPAHRSVYFRAIRVSTESGTALEFLRGTTESMNEYRVGGLVLWRGAATATEDCAVAEACMKSGERGVMIIFKIVRAISARRVANFSHWPELSEALFPPYSFFRVLDFHNPIREALRRGTEEASPWDIESSPPPVSLGWEVAARQRKLLIVLSEEERPKDLLERS